MVEKRFPANTNLDEKTFLNNNKINGKLYSYLLGISKVKDKETFIYKEDFPTLKKLCEILDYKDNRTVKKDIGKLEEFGFLVKAEDGYYLPKVEMPYYVSVPQNLASIMGTTYNEYTAKVYVYLASEYRRNNGNFEFTYELIASHLGLYLNGRQEIYERLGAALAAIQEMGLITWEIKKIGYKTYNKIISVKKFSGLHK